jgi:hypothetical protein
VTFISVEYVAVDLVGNETNNIPVSWQRIAYGYNTLQQEALSLASKKTLYGKAKISFVRPSITQV